MMKKAAAALGGIFAVLSSMNMAGILKTYIIHEPKAPHLRDTK